MSELEEHTEESSSLTDSASSLSSAARNDNLDRWETRWKENNLRWHKNEINPYLQKFINLIVDNSLEKPDEVPKCGKAPTQTTFVTKEQNTNGETRVEQLSCPSNPNDKTSRAKRFFLPLCGKSWDIAYILSQGHEVFGVEGIVDAIKALDEENSFNFLFDSEESTFHTKDKKLCIFYGDIFKCPIEKWGPFDCVWDKASLTAIDLSLRTSYKDIMQRSLKKINGEYNNFCYLLQTVNYDKSKADGRGPKCVDENDMNELYGDWTEMSLLESVPLHENHVIRRIPNVGSKCNEEIYLLRPKGKTNS